MIVKKKKKNKISAFSQYLYVHGIHAKRIDTCKLAQLCSFAHLLHWYLVYLCRGMKLIVIAYYPNNSHFYFFSLNLFILAYINNRRISDWRHVVSSLLWIIVQKRAYTHLVGITTIDIYPFVYFDFCWYKRESDSSKHIYI